MSEVIVTSAGVSRAVSFEGTLLLAQAVGLAGFTLARPCGGNHTCGKCLVAASGALSPVGEDEARLLAGRQGYRLACMAQAVGDARVTLYDALADAVVETGVRETGAAGGEADGYGFAVDIGTTTVAVYLCDLRRGETCATLGAASSQAPMGADVISRIKFTMEHSPAAPGEAIREQLYGMFGTLLAGAGLDKSDVRRAVITGNTTMLHFLCGLDARAIAAAPFTPQSLFGEARPMSELFPGYNASLYLPRCMHSYVGADITCAVTASDMCADSRALLADVGTNGELALWADGRLTCCSTAAGPAFEGAQIYMGMNAAPGAIDSVSFDGEKLVAHTIGNAPPRGLCGTGLVSALACLVGLGVVDETGRIDEDCEYPALLTQYDGKPAVALGGGVLLTQADVRAVQLAKAAVAAGIDTLLHSAGLAPCDLERFYVCGGFGSCIDYGEAEAIGLFPPVGQDKTVACGNAAGAGAISALLSSAQRSAQETLAGQATVVELSTDAYFMERYIENMSFGGAL